jgi:hypothetical protein
VGEPNDAPNLKSLPHDKLEKPIEDTHHLNVGTILRVTETTVATENSDGFPFPA